MAWIESHQELARHPKTKRLARELGQSLPTTVGHLQFLWWWAMDYAQDGDLTRFDAGDIADAVMWTGDANELINALLASRFLDQSEKGLVIHDWYRYAGRLVEKRAANAKRMRDERAKEKNERATHMQRTNNPRSGATVPNHTVPNHTVPNHTVPNHTQPKQGDSEQTSVDQEVAAAVEEPKPSESSNDELAQLGRIYQESGFGQMTPLDAELLKVLLDDYGFDWVVEALKEAVANNKRRLKYVKSILQNWRAEGGIRHSDHQSPRSRGKPPFDARRQAAMADERYQNFVNQYNVSRAGSNAADNE